jgi:SAM-dependent methyltransferase
MPNDTGSQLRSLYESDGGVRNIFSSKVTDYVASRPDYPAALFEFLRAECNLTPGAAVADIGSGTGLLTRGLLTRGCDVTGIEPNAEMRVAAERLLADKPTFRSVDGSAESIPATASSFDLIVAAQAFHWFEVHRARAEALRVLKPHGKVALIWNDRVWADPLHIALDEVFAKYGGSKRDALAAHKDQADVPTFFGAAVPIEARWPHEHHLDENGFLSLVFSRSYMPDRKSPLGKEAGQQVREVFQRFANDGWVPVRYSTVAIVGRPR